MKNLDTLTAEEMRQMLKNISGILENRIENVTTEQAAHIQVEMIGNEFFNDAFDSLKFLN